MEGMVFRSGNRGPWRNAQCARGGCGMEKAVAAQRVARPLSEDAFRVKWIGGLNVECARRDSGSVAHGAGGKYRSAFPSAENPLI